MKQSEHFPPSKIEKIICVECSAGMMKREPVTYYTWLGSELITVTDFPAWVCDQCGRREYDIDALNRLSILLSPTAGKPFERKRPTPTPVPAVGRPRAVRRKTKG